MKDSIYERRIELAEKFLQDALQTNRLILYLRGCKPYDLKFPNKETGEFEVHISYLLDALYSLHKKRPDLEIDKKVYYSLSRNLDVTLANFVRKDYLTSLSYMIECEKGHKATFKLDYNSLLKILKNRIELDKIFLENDGKEYKDRIGPFDYVDKSVENLTKKVSTL